MIKCPERAVVDHKEVKKATEILIVMYQEMNQRTNLNSMQNKIKRINSFFLQESTMENIITIQDMRKKRSIKENKS